MEKNKVGDDDCQSRAFICSKWMEMEMMVARIEAVRAKGERAEVGEEVSERNADSGNVTEQCYGNNWVWERIHAVIDCTKKKI